MSRTNLRVRRPRLAMARVLCAGALALAVGAAEVPAVASGEDDPAATEEARIIRDQVAYLAMLDRAEAQLAKGDADAAIEILEKAMALDVPDSTLPRANVPTRNATAHYGLACAFAAKGDLDAARRFLSGMQVFTLAESLGGVESLIEHPAIMTHASVPKDRREALGIADGFIRASVGIEHLDDLKADLLAALDRV